MQSKATLSWAMYDFSNSAYGSLIPVLLFPLYFKSVILDNGASVDLWWGIIAGVSILLSGIIAPFLGVIADATLRRKAFFVATSVGAIIGTGALAFAGSMTPLVATMLFIVTNMLYNVANVLYDALLPHVSSTKNRGSISGFGWGVGYIGAIVCTFLVLPFLRSGVEEPSYAVSFIIVAAFFFIFSLPAFLFIPEATGRKQQTRIAIRESVASVTGTIRSWRKHRPLMRFLFASYFFTEGIATVFYFMGLYASTTLSVSAADFAILVVVNMVVACPVTILIGRYSDKMGYKNIILLSVAVWILVIVLLGIAQSYTMLFWAAVIAGFAIGTSQAAARAWFSRMVPAKNYAQFFGFNALATKISATMGPVLFGVISFATGSQRIAVFSIILYFLVSFVLFFRLPSPAVHVGSTRDKQNS